MNKSLIVLILGLAISLCAPGVFAKGPKEDKGKKEKSAKEDEIKADKGKPEKADKGKPDKMKEEHGKPADGDTAGSMDKGKGHKEMPPGQMKKEGKAEGAEPEEGSTLESGASVEEKLTGQRRALAEIDNQIAKENAKHNQRVAKIERVREVMAEQGDEEGKKEAANLMQQENERHDRRMAQLSERRQKFEARIGELEGQESHGKSSGHGKDK